MITPVVWISPVFNDEAFFDNNGVVLAGGKIETYAAGSFSIAQSAYTDNSGDTVWTNPIVLDSSGRISGGALWLDSTLVYNLVVYMPDGITVLKNIDNVTGVPIISSSSSSTTVWATAPTPTYVSGTQFLVPGNYSTQFAIGNRVQLQFSDLSYQYGTVSDVTFSSPNTQVTIVNDSTDILSTLTNVWFSVLTTQGYTVDAGAVSYNSSNTYADANTVGAELKAIDAANTRQDAVLAEIVDVWTTTFDGTQTFTITPIPEVTSLSTFKMINVKFNADHSGTDTLLVINSLPAQVVNQYDSSGNIVTAKIKSGQTSVLLYDGSNFILQNPLPDVAPVPPGSVVNWGYAYHAATLAAGSIFNFTNGVQSTGISYSNGTVTVSAAGIYLISAGCHVQGDYSYLSINIQHNGGDTAYKATQTNGNNDGHTIEAVVGGLLYLDIGETVSIKMIASSGSIPSSLGFFTGVKIS